MAQLPKAQYNQFLQIYRQMGIPEDMIKTILSPGMSTQQATNQFRNVYAQNQQGVPAYNMNPQGQRGPVQPQGVNQSTDFNPQNTAAGLATSRANNIATAQSQLGTPVAQLPAGPTPAQAVNQANAQARMQSGTSIAPVAAVGASLGQCIQPVSGMGQTTGVGNGYQYQAPGSVPITDPGYGKPVNANPSKTTVPNIPSVANGGGVAAVDAMTPMLNTNGTVTQPTFDAFSQQMQANHGYTPRMDEYNGAIADGTMSTQMAASPSLANGNVSGAGGAGSSTDWGMKGMGGTMLGVGQLGLGLMSYLDGKKTQKKQRALMDQQLASNKYALNHKKKSDAAWASTNF